MARGKRPIFERLSDDGRLLGYQVNIRKRGFPTVSRQFQRAAEKTGCAGPTFTTSGMKPPRAFSSVAST